MYVGTSAVADVVCFIGISKVNSLCLGNAVCAGNRDVHGVNTHLVLHLVVSEADSVKTAGEGLSFGDYGCAVIVLYGVNGSTACVCAGRIIIVNVKGRVIAVEEGVTRCLVRIGGRHGNVKGSDRIF